MSGIVALAFIDCFDLAVSLKANLSSLTERDEGSGIKYLMLRRRKEDGSFVYCAPMRRWVAMANTLKRVQRMAAEAAPRLIGTAVEFGEIELELLEPGAVIPWHNAVSAGPALGMSLELPLRTNPSAMIYSGTACGSPGYGVLTYVDRSFWRSAINLGETGRVHLVMNLLSKESP